MKYSVLHFSFDDKEGFVSDILAAQLGEIGFDTFENTEFGLDAYVPDSSYNEEAVLNLLSEFPYDIEIGFEKESLEDKNWNEEWEKHFFEPIIIADKCVIHSSFHQNIPKLEYDIIIDPKMAFGTGHHETTSLIIAEILETDVQGERVLDMGCGTSVLAILASMRGASELTAIDIDDWCVDNSLENIALNKIKNIDVKLGDASLLPGMKFDIVLANINRNILLNDMDKYADCLPKDGLLFMSGFYTEDVPVLQKKANELGLKMLYFKQKNNWAAMKLTKE